MAGNTERRAVYTTGLGRIRYCTRCGQEQSNCRCTSASGADASVAQTPRDGIVRIARDKKGRHGKVVTMITGLPDDGELTAALAQAFKRLCGSGGTVKPGGQIEIQGDHRDKLEAKLIELGHRVKRVGG